MRTIFYKTFFFLSALFLGGVSLHAAVGVIDPSNHGTVGANDNQYAALYPSGDQINTGDFSTATSANVSVSDTELRGFFFGETTGWIVLNCADTTSGCSSTNGNFKVANDGNGNLSGYAWGENTGWVSFYCGNETVNNCSTSGNFRVTINTTTGFFSGYAWSQNFGWIHFDCGAEESCTETDWRPAPGGGCTGGGCSTGGGGYIPQCNNSSDDDGDGFNNYPADPGCTSLLDNSEINVIITPPPYVPQCLNGIDDDGDGLIDYPLDPGCSSALDDSERNTVTTPPECSNSIDDDGDGFIDYPSDPGCGAPLDNSEMNTIVTPPPVDPVEPPGGGGPGPSNPPPVDTGGGTPVPPPGGSTLGTNQFAFLQTLGKGFIPKLVGLGGLLAGFGALFVNPDFLLIPFRLWSLLLAFFGLRKKPWGTVYDAVTKQALDPVYLQLKDLSGNTVATSITDIDGRYGFLVKKGSYIITAEKTHYRFPSQLLAGKKADEVYSDLYFGDVIEVNDDSSVIVKNIPLDPLAFDWNEFAKKRDHLLSFSKKNKRILSEISGVLFGVGLIISIIALVVSPVLYNIVICALYVVMLAFQYVSYRASKKVGVITDSTGTPLSFAIVHIISKSTGVEIAKKPTNQFGQYYMLVQNGVYSMVIDRKNTDGTYTTAVLTKDIYVTKGYVGLEVIV